MFYFRTCTRSVGLAWLLAVFALAGCATKDLEQFNRDLANLNQKLAGGPVGLPVNARGMATQATPDNGKAIELVVPNDKATEAAMDAALPTIKKVLSIHQCVSRVEGMRQLNFHSLPGNDFSGGYVQFPMSDMRYHDMSKCLSVRTLDRWSMPAMNALVFRAVYFADDSGETTTHQLRFMRASDGSWRLAEISLRNSSLL